MYLGGQQPCNSEMQQHSRQAPALQGCNRNGGHDGSEHVTKTTQDHCFLSQGRSFLCCEQLGQIKLCYSSCCADWGQCTSAGFSVRSFWFDYGPLVDSFAPACTSAAQQNGSRQFAEACCSKQAMHIAGVHNTCLCSLQAVAGGSRASYSCT